MPSFLVAMVHLDIATKQTFKYKFRAAKLAYFLQITDLVKSFPILTYFYHTTLQTLYSISKVRMVMLALILGNKVTGLGSC
jgi:hypothetical protein